MIEEGALPRRSRAAHKVIESAETGLDDTSKPLHDFDLLHAAIAKSHTAGYLDRCFNGIDVCLPECCTIDNRIHYALAYDRFHAASTRRGAFERLEAPRGAFRNSSSKCGRHARPYGAVPARRP